MMKKKKYDTSVVMLYLIGKEHLLPREFRRKIPYSTVASWRRIDYDSYIGQEYRIFFEDRTDYLALQKTAREQSQILRGLARAWVLLREDVFPVIRQAQTDPALQRRVITAIEYLRGGMTLRRTLRLFGLSQKRYQEWAIIVRGYCTASHSFLCVRRYPHQLQKKEVHQMKKALAAPRNAHWPISAIAGAGLRRNSIVASLYSWYKYARLLQLPHKTDRGQKRPVGLLAQRPNEYLHVDTTYYFLTADQKVCISFVMDNYSKMILGFQVAERLSFQVVKDALVKALKTVGRHPEQLPVYLVADGGSENHNRHIDGFLAQLSGFKISKIRSLKDIRFSNSPVEAIHRVIKSRYLRNRRFDSLEQLEHYLEWAVYDYNVLRPHYAHLPQTPQEVYFGKALPFDSKDRIRAACKKRVQKNKSLACNACSGNAALLALTSIKSRNL
jgi:transposase InsO family protein